MTALRLVEPADQFLKTPVCLPAGSPWNGMTLPNVPPADWPAALALDHAVDRIVRDALATGRTLQEIVSGVTTMAQSLSLPLTDAEINVRVHAQLMANT